MEAIEQAPVYGRLGRNEANSSHHPELKQSTVASHEDNLKQALLGSRCYKTNQPLAPLLHTPFLKIRHQTDLHKSIA